MRNSKNREHIRLGQNIAKLREAQNWSQDELANKSGVAISSLKDIERGVAEGYLSTRKALAEALGCPISSLYEDGGAKEVDFGACGALLSTISTLKPSRKGFVLALIYSDESYLRSDDEALHRAYRALQKSL